MRRFSRLNTRIAYPGVLGVTTEKGQQDVKPNVLDAPTESYEIMLLRWQTGVFEVDADAPDVPEPEPEYPELAFNLQQQLMSLSMPSATAKELALQITNETYSQNRLAWAGIPVALAMYLATSLKDGTYDAVKAVALGMIPAIAALLAGLGVGVWRSASGFVWRTAAGTTWLKADK